SLPSSSLREAGKTRTAFVIFFTRGTRRDRLWSNPRWSSALRPSAAVTQKARVALECSSDRGSDDAHPRAPPQVFVHDQPHASKSWHLIRPHPHQFRAIVAQEARQLADAQAHGCGPNLQEPVVAAYRGAGTVERFAGESGPHSLRPSCVSDDVMPAQAPAPNGTSAGSQVL